MIEIRGVWKTFGSQSVLCGADLTVEAGQTVVIIGRSGCGKSVLLKHIVGLIEPDRGTITVDGQPISDLRGAELMKLRLNFGMLFQGAALFDSMTVFENVGFTLLEHGKLPYGQVRERVAQALRSVDLPGIEDKYPADLSGGMKKRVGLARAMCNRPKIMLYDEPTTGLDPISADLINDLIIRMHTDYGVTSIVVTHDMTSAFKVGTSIAMLYQGKIIGQGSPEEIQRTSDPVIKQFVTGAAQGPITEQSNE